MNTNHSLIIAHRGESFDAPENTLASVNLAWERGADAVEIDVQLSRDNKIIVIHDTNTRRVGNKFFQVKDQTVSELKQLDVGSWKNDKWKNERIPTFEEVLETVPEGKKLIVEIKCGPEILNELFTVINDSRLRAEQIEFICFNLNICREIKNILPDYKVLLLSELDYTWLQRIFRPSIKKLISSALSNNLDGLDLWNSSMVDRDLVAKCRNNNLLLYIWTVNSPETAKKLLDLGVHGITTDRAQWLKENINSH